MAIYKEDIIDINMDTGNVYRSFAHRRLGEWDEKGDVFGVRLLKHGQEVSLRNVSGAGLFKRADGVTVDVPFSKRGNIAFVTLPKTCYAVTGGFELSIKLTTAANATTVRIVDGTVTKTSFGGQIDPQSGDYIPDMEGLQDLLDEINGILETISQYDIQAVQINGTRYRIEITEPEV